MDQRGLTPVEGVESQEFDNPVPATADEQNDEPVEPSTPTPEPQKPQQVSTEPTEQMNAPLSPEPESGIGKDVDSCEMDPDGDLGKGDDIQELEKPKANDDIMELQPPSPNTSEDEGPGEETQVVSVETADKSKTTSKPPRFDNSVEPISYEVPVPRAPRGGFGGHMGRGPRKAVAIIIIVSVISVALVVGLVLAADLPPPKPTAKVYGYMETNNIMFRPEFNRSTTAHYRLAEDFLTSMELLFFSTSFESAYNNTKIIEFGKNMNGYLTIDFTMGLRYFFDNTTGTTDDKPATGNTSTLPVTTTTASMETTMELPTIDGDTPGWVANIIYFVYKQTAMGKLGNFTGTMSLSDTDPDDDITTKRLTTMMMTTPGGTA